jgi:hypothetical protein
LQPAGSSMRLEIDQPLSAGRYWVRVYHATGSGDPLREFGINVQ